MLVVSPLSVQTSKSKKFILNLNQYRNTHFHVLNAAKVEYKALIHDQLAGKSLQTPIIVTYTYFPKTKRRTDLGNVLSIHQKFFEDALTELGCIEDDDYTRIVQTIYTFGDIDKSDPRVEIKIAESLCCSN